MATPRRKGEKYQQKAHIDRIHAMQEMKDIQEEKRVMTGFCGFPYRGMKNNRTFRNLQILWRKKLIEDFSYIFSEE